MLFHDQMTVAKARVQGVGSGNFVSSVLLGFY